MRRLQRRVLYDLMYSCILYARVNLISHMVWRIIDNGVSCRWSETRFLFRRWSRPLEGGRSRQIYTRAYTYTTYDKYVTRYAYNVPILGFRNIIMYIVFTNVQCTYYMELLYRNTTTTTWPWIRSNIQQRSVTIIIIIIIYNETHIRTLPSS